MFVWTLYTRARFRHLNLFFFIQFQAHVSCVYFKKATFYISALCRLKKKSQGKFCTKWWGFLRCIHHHHLQKWRTQLLFRPVCSFGVKEVSEDDARHILLLKSACKKNPCICALKSQVYKFKNDKVPLKMGSLILKWVWASSTSRCKSQQADRRAKPDTHLREGQVSSHQ